MIETPRRVTYDWFGEADDAPTVGSFLASESGKRWRIVAERRVNVRVDRGQTSRHRLEIVSCTVAETLNGTIRPIVWNTRARR